MPLNLVKDRSLGKWLLFKDSRTVILLGMGDREKVKEPPMVPKAGGDTLDRLSLCVALFHYSVPPSKHMLALAF